MGVCCSKPAVVQPQCDIEAAPETKAAEDSPPEYAGAAAPVCELARRQHLLDLNLLHTEPEARFDDITKLCSMAFKVPIALVSLVDTQIQWFKSAQGLRGVDKTPRNTSFCAWTLLPAYPEALVVEDAQQDARFKDNPLVVDPPHIRFYAGCPLVCSNGMRLGSLCIIDMQPRSFGAESCNMLANMAEMVVREIEKDKALEEQRLRQLSTQQDHKQLLRAINCFSEAIMLVDMSSEDWSIVFANEAWERLVGKHREPGDALNFWSVFQSPGQGSASSQATCSDDYAEAIANQQNFELLIYFNTAGNSNTANTVSLPGQHPTSLPQRTSLSGVRHVAMAQFRCAANTGLDSHMPLIGIPNFLPNTSDGAHSFYFATLKEVPVALGNGVGNQGGVHTQAGGRRPSFSLMAGNEPFADIKLGPLLGKGSFGRVFRGVWNGKMVAVKVIEYAQQQNEDGCLLEGLLSEQVQHPHVVRTFKHATRPLKTAIDDDYYHLEQQASEGALRPSGDGTAKREQMMETWLVLEFCNKGCVADAVTKGWFRKKGSQFEADMGPILATAREVASALAYLHSRNILHGDLTGNNVLLTAAAGERRGYNAKVSDFGLSRLISSDAPVIETRTYGTVTHMPAELLLEGKMSKAVDVYSFGVVLWEMFMGRGPYVGLSHSQVLHNVSMGKVLQLPQSAPADFRQLVTSCLARNPAHRPAFDDVVLQLSAMEAKFL